MKIVLDPEIFHLQKYGGISRYYTELFSILSKKNRVIIPLYSTTNVYYNQSNLVTVKQKIYSIYIRILLKLRLCHKENTRIRNEKFLKKILNKKNYDLFIPTYYNSYFIKNIDSKPFVLTVYDMIHELFPEYFVDDPLKVVENKKIMIEKATKIIAVSQNTKKDIIKFYPYVDVSKIEVVYHGCSLKYNEIDNIDLPNNYILFVGSRGGYKNFIFFVNAIAELLNYNTELFVICAGGGLFNTSEIQIIEKLGLQKQIVQINFKDENLSVFYKKAKCFVFPSLYEGFGIPVLEAMQSGCPVVLGNHSSFPEVAGEAGVYFETNNREDLKSKIKMLLENDHLREEFSLKGIEQVKKFSWEKAAKECYTIYQKACNPEN